MASRSKPETTTATPFVLPADPQEQVIADRLRQARAALIVIENGYVAMGEPRRLKRAKPKPRESLRKRSARPGLSTSTAAPAANPTAR